VGETISKAPASCVSFEHMKMATAKACGFQLVVIVAGRALALADRAPQEKRSARIGGAPD